MNAEPECDWMSFSGFCAWSFCCAMLCISAAYAVVRYLSVTFMYSVQIKTNVLELFSLSGISTILVFPKQTLWQYSVECRCGRQKSRLSTNSCRLWIDDCCSANNNCDGPPYSLRNRPPRISEFLFITTMYDRDEENRTEQFSCTQYRCNLQKKASSWDIRSVCSVLISNPQSSSWSFASVRR